MTIKLVNPMLLQASWFAKAGYPVLPLYEPTAEACSCGDASCSRVGKHPRTSHGLDDATTKMKIIDNWWKRRPMANIGVATGIKSGFFVLDIDGDEGRATLASMMADGAALPVDAKINTGRGEHYWFRCEELHVRGRRLGPGLDVRGERGYVVGSGSLHASGRRYRHAHWGDLTGILDRASCEATAW